MGKYQALSVITHYTSMILIQERNIFAAITRLFFFDGVGDCRACESSQCGRMGGPEA